MPISSCDLRLENEDIRVAVGFRLGTALCKPHQCPCGALVDVTGLHGLSRKLRTSKHARHNVINDLIARAVTLADISYVKEPQGLSRSDKKRPDGMTLIPWKARKCALWDVTVINTVAQLYVSQSSRCAGSAVELAATRKSSKYGEHSTIVTFLFTLRWSHLVQFVHKHCPFSASSAREGLQCPVTFARQRIFFNVF